MLLCATIINVNATALHCGFGEMRKAIHLRNCSFLMPLCLSGENIKHVGKLLIWSLTLAGWMSTCTNSTNMKAVVIRM